MYPTIVSPEWLNENINQPDIRIFDGTFFETEQTERAQRIFAKEHILNSYQLLLRGRDYNNDFFLKIPKPTTFTMLATQQGFSRGVHAIIYDRDDKSAIKVWWLFQYYSHVKVSILHGGMKLWVEKGFPMELMKQSTLAPAPVTGFSATPRADMLVKPREMKEFLSSVEIVQPKDFPIYMDAIQQYERVIDQKQILSQLNVGDILKSNNNYCQLIDTREGPPQTANPPLPNSIKLPYTTFYKNGHLVTDILKIKQIFREKKISTENQLLIYGENGFDAVCVALVCFLYTGKGISGIQILQGSISAYYVFEQTGGSMTEMTRSQLDTSQVEPSDHKAE